MVELGNLARIRADFQETLELAGLKTSKYNNENLKPPVAVVIPGERYIDIRARAGVMNDWNIYMDILIISGGTKDNNLDELDNLIEKVIMTLCDQTNPLCQLDNVAAPAKITLEKGGNSYYASVVTVQYQTAFEK